jgi:hypothetical protein
MDISAVTCRMSPQQRLYQHSLSNMALGTAFALLLIFGFYIHRTHARGVADQGARDALMAAVVGMGEVVVVCDENGIITHASESARDIFHMELVGKQIHSLCPAESRARADAAFSATVAEIKKTNEPSVFILPHAMIGHNDNKPFSGSIKLRVVPEYGRGLLIVAVFTPQAAMRSLPITQREH